MYACLFCKFCCGGERVIKYQLKMTEFGFMYNQDLFGHDEQADQDSNDWFGECRQQKGEVIIPDCTVQVPEVFRSISEPIREPIKPLISTTASALDELHAEYNSFEPISSQIEVPSTDQEQPQINYVIVEEDQEPFFPQLSQVQPQIHLPIVPKPTVQEAVKPTNHREYQEIQVKDTSQTYRARSRVEKGERFETKNMCKHVHTETARYLKKCIAFHRLSEEEKQQVKQFCGNKHSIPNFKTLFLNKKISELCRTFYQSQYFIKEILSSKMETRSKMIIIKYLERIRRLTYDPNFKAWKKEITIGE